MRPMRHSQHERELGQSQQHKWATQSTQGGREIGKREESLTRRGWLLPGAFTFDIVGIFRLQRRMRSRRGTRRVVRTDLRFLPIVEVVVRDGR